MHRVIIHTANPGLGRVLGTVLRGYTVQTISSEPWLHIILTTTTPVALFLDGTLDDAVARCADARSHTTAPILVLVASRDPAERVALLHAGADDVIVRPFGKHELGARLRAKLRRAGAPFEQAAAPTPFFRRAGQMSMPLSPIELQLLAVLQQNRGMFVPSTELQRAIWAEPSNANRLHYHMHHLRHQLSQLGCDARIETRRGSGYRLVE